MEIISIITNAVVAVVDIILIVVLLRRWKKQ